MSLDKKILELRTGKGWSQTDVALQLDISQAAYNKWESGQSKPSLQNLQKLAEIFDVDFYDLIKEQIPNLDLSNAKFENSPFFVIESTHNTISYDSPELINKILENQQQMAKLMESQSKLIEILLKK
ncbi:helix-turn-helix transcriptional regulator [Chryseobacterium aquaticum]|uniref:helix-turn-helix domain-containing protein n=1 Tax=Chryseobacterium aquaticum TaxID=452084 RepID=UPI002FC993C4